VPAWTFRAPAEVDDQGTFTASPTVVEGVVYIGGWNGVMYALDLGDGHVIWQHQTPTASGATYGPIVSSAAVSDVRVGGRIRRLVVFGSGPRLFALDAASGKTVWVNYLGRKAKDVADPGEVQSSPLIYRGRVFVGFDVHNKGGDRTGGARGGLVSLDAGTGKVRWRYEPEAKAGQPASGCGGEWGSPTLDTKTDVIYFGTANCPAVSKNPKLPMEELTALHASSGRRIWTFRPHQKPGQKSYDDKDEDFGATPNLFVTTAGRKVIGAGSKDGSYYVLDARTGKLVWNTKVVTPAPGVGGFIGSPAVWHGNVFGGTAISAPLPAFHSFDGTKGSVRWQGGGAPTYAATAVANGVVFSGALDFTFKAMDAATGQVLWASPALGAVSSGAAIAGDTVVVGSGTSTSDACAKGNPTDQACVFAFDTALAQQGGVHAFRLAPVG
jgi:outer membrane protein assembly factor BamB